MPRHYAIAVEKMPRCGMPRFAPDLVRRFYDRSTPGFGRLGQGGRTGAIRRAVWGPGVTDRVQAFHFVDHEIAEHARALAPSAAPLHVVDLGCGVGGSLCYLAARLPMRGTGITLSPVQVAHAQARIRAAGLADRVTCSVGDYCDLPSSIGPADLAYAIESFVHGPDPVRFFTQCRDLVRPGGRLILCDDFRGDTSEPAAARALDRFRDGWHVNTLLNLDEVQAIARLAGFTLHTAMPLTPMLELGRPRDRLIKAFLAVFGWLPLHRTPLGHLVGGDALQTCLQRGWLRHDLLVFVRD